MPPETRYRVVILPRRETAAEGLTLKEAAAWVQTYNAAARTEGREAVLAEEEGEGGKR